MLDFLATYVKFLSICFSEYYLRDLIIVEKESVTKRFLFLKFFIIRPNQLIIKQKSEQS